MNYSLDSLFGIKDNVVIITGGTKGIGKEIAAALLGLKAIPIVWGSSESSVVSAKTELEKIGGSFSAMQVDVGNEDQVIDAVNIVLKKYGRIDGLINSAGTTHIQELHNFPIEEFTRVMHINVTGTLICSKHISNIMVEKGGGSIINISSVRGFQGKSRYSAYATSKGAINNLTRTLAVELAESNITVNAIAPSFIKTDISEVVLKDKPFMDWALSRIPAGRLGTPSDCVGAALFLLSPASRFISGVILPVDGGWLAG